MAVVCCGLNIVSALLILAEDCDAKVLNKILQILSLHVFPMMMVTMRVVMRVPRVTEQACKQEAIMEIQTVLEFSHTHRGQEANTKKCLFAVISTPGTKQKLGLLLGKKRCVRSVRILNSCL